LLPNFKTITTQPINKSCSINSSIFDINSKQAIENCHTDEYSYQNPHFNQNLSFDKIENQVKQIFIITAQSVVNTFYQYIDVNLS
jgi:hypothetical protein